MIIIPWDNYWSMGLSFPASHHDYHCMGSFYWSTFSLCVFRWLAGMGFLRNSAPHRHPSWNQCRKVLQLVRGFSGFHGKTMGKAIVIAVYSILYHSYKSFLVGYHSYTIEMENHSYTIVSYKYFSISSGISHLFRWWKTHGLKNLWISRITPVLAPP